MGTIESCCAWPECFEHNGMLLDAYCGLSVHAAGILFHSVISRRYYLIYAYCCLQHPFIYNHVRYCDIYGIIWLADFQFKFYIRERERERERGGVIHFFFYESGSPFFTIFFIGESLIFLESF